MIRRLFPALAAAAILAAPICLAQAPAPWPSAGYVAPAERPDTTQILPPPPTTMGSSLAPVDYHWLLIAQNLQPHNLVDTTAGAYEETAPPAGLNPATGQSAQCKELTYAKTSSDGNTYTLNGVEGGPYTLTGKPGAPGSFLKIKSDGTKWWRVG